MSQRIVISVILFLFVAALVIGGTWWLQRDSASAQPSSDEFRGLAKQKQKEIWDREHVTFEIETYVGKPFAQTLIDRSVADLTEFFHADFQGSFPGETDPVESQQATIIQRTSSAAESSVTTTKSREFCDHLLAALEPIVEIQAARLRVLKISRDTSDDRLWSLDVLLTATGIDEKSFPVQWESHGHITCRFSRDEEIHAGKILARWNITDEVLRTSRGPLMEEITAEVGLDQIPIQDNWNTPLDYVRQYIFQSAAADYDGDGDLDIAVATADGECFLLEFDDGRFRDVTNTSGILQEGFNSLRSYLASWIDFDNDGDPDLLLGSKMYRNVDGERFEPVPGNAGLQIRFNPMGSIVADYDCDGRLDLYVLYQRTPDAVRTETPAWVGDDQSGAPNQLWRNTGSDRFEDVTDAANASGGARHTFAAVWLHANDDHFPDLYIANDFGANTLLINRGDGRFDDHTEKSRTGDYATSMGVAAGDIDDDGRPEIYVANMFSKMGRRIIAQVDSSDYPEGIYQQLLGSCAGNRLYQVSADGTRYQEKSEPLGINQVGWAYAPAFADFDGDGDLDIYATTGFMSFDRRKPDG